MIDDNSTIDQRCFESFRNIHLTPQYEDGFIVNEIHKILSIGAIMRTHKAIPEGDRVIYIDGIRVLSLVPYRDLISGEASIEDGLAQGYSVVPSTPKTSEQYGEMLEELLFGIQGERKVVTIITSSKEITKKILEGPNIREVASVLEGTEIEEPHSAPHPLKHYSHFKAVYQAEGFEPKKLRIYTNNITPIEEMCVPKVCHYCEQQFQDGDVVSVKFEQRGQVLEVLHTVIDDLVDDEGMRACREIAFMNEKTSNLAGYIGVYYQGRVYDFEGLSQEAEFEMNDERTAHRMTNVKTLAFKLKPLTEE